jgi:hypothetical protein
MKAAQSSLPPLAAVGLLSLSGCATYVPPRGSDTQVATIRGNDHTFGFGGGTECRAAEIDGKLVRWYYGGQHKIAPGHHIVTFHVDRKGEVRTSGSYWFSIPRGRFADCRFELDVQPGHSYVVNDVARVQIDQRGSVSAVTFEVTDTSAGGRSNTVLHLAKCNDETPDSGSRQVASAASPPTAGAAPAAAVAGSAVQTPTVRETAPSGMPKVGDRWTYRLSDWGRERVMINIEIIAIGAGRVTERITRDGYPAFMIERSVDAKFDPARFQPPVTFPGGYPQWEIAPYFPMGTPMAVGDSWGPVSGEFSGPLIGKATMAARVSVVDLEQVSVPAGTFDAWEVQTEPMGSLTAAATVTCTFWYSARSLRTVKMRCDTAPTSWLQASKASEIYELSQFQPGQ